MPCAAMHSMRPDLMPETPDHWSSMPTITAELPLHSALEQSLHQTSGTRTESMLVLNHANVAARWCYHGRKHCVSWHESYLSTSLDHG